MRARGCSAPKRWSSAPAPDHPRRPWPRPSSRSRSTSTAPVTAEDAVAHFLRAHELDPTNWSYIREALSLADPEWGPVYPRNLLAEVEAVGVETFYPSLDM